MIRIVGRVLAGAGLVLVTCLAAASPAAAHASLVATDPADGAVLATTPDTVTLTFDEPVTVREGAARLFATDFEEPLPASARDREVVVDLPDPLADGSYLVNWRVVSADGHPITGVLRFAVGAPSGPVRADVEGDHPAVVAGLGLAQSLQYGGLLVATGLVAFLLLVLPWSEGVELARARLVRFTRVAATTAVAGSALVVPWQGAYERGAGPGAVLGVDAWETGAASPVVVAAAWVVLGSLVLVRMIGRIQGPGPTARLALVVAAATVVAPVVAGHTRSFGPALLVLAADAVHLAAAAAWTGGLVGLVVALRALVRREQQAARTLARFSSLAGGLLLAVALTGTLLGWRYLGSWSALVDTTYGRLLLAKVLLVAAVAAVAGWNRYALLPRVLSAHGHQDRLAAGDRLRQAVRLEAVGLVLATVVAGFLVGQSPTAAAPTAPADTSAGPGVVEQRVTAGAVTADVRAVAAADGSHRLEVRLLDQSAAPLAPYAPPTLRVRGEGVDLGEVALDTEGIGRYLARVTFPRPGAWELTLSVRVTELDNPVLLVPLPIPGR